MAANSPPRRRSMPASRRKKTPQQQPRHQRTRRSDAARSPRYPAEPVPLFIHLVRLVILGLGASTIAGTAISISNPPKPEISTKIEPPLRSPNAIPIAALKLTRSSPELDRQLQAAILQRKGSATNKNSKLDPSYLFVEIDSGEYSELGADRLIAAANTIRLPILIALFQDIDAQKIQPTEKLTMAGGTQTSILTLATQMTIVSDNTATNLLIDRLGGAAALNQRFRDWGLAVTSINHPLPDREGTNITTVRELARSIMAIERGKIVSDASRSQILSLIGNTMRSKGVGSDAKLDRQTGNIGSIELPTGKKYLATILVKSPPNDPIAAELTRQLSTIANKYFNN